MSENAQNIFYIYHSSLPDLLQGVQGGQGPLTAIQVRLGWGVPAVHVQPLCVRVGLVVVWGVLVTARRGDEIRSAWCVAEQTRQPVGAEGLARAMERQGAVRQRIEEIVRAAGLQVQPGVYAVPADAFRQVAVLCPEPAGAEPGGQP